MTYHASIQGILACLKPTTLAAVIVDLHEACNDEAHQTAQLAQEALANNVGEEDAQALIQKAESV